MPSRAAVAERAEKAGANAPPKVDQAAHRLPRQKLKRDRFTMPEADYALIASLKKQARDAGRPARKNELLRAGLRALCEAGSTELRRALERLEPVRRERDQK
jgi:hypothetical protein